MTFSSAASCLINSQAQQAREITVTRTVKITVTESVKTAEVAPPINPLLPRLGFCKNKEEEAELIEAGIHPDLIWMRGRGVESLEWCFDWLRGRPGIICIVGDLRDFGTTRKAIHAWTARFLDQGVMLLDVVTGETNLSRLTERAFVAMSAGAGIKNHRMARNRGRKGGEKKGARAAAERAAIMGEEIIKRLCAREELTWDDCVEILGEPFNKSTLQRHYRN